MNDLLIASFVLVLFQMSPDSEMDVHVIEESPFFMGRVKPAYTPLKDQLEIEEELYHYPSSLPGTIPWFHTHQNLWGEGG